MSIESVMPSNHLILCHPLLLLPSIFPSIRVFPVSQLLASGGQSTGVSASKSVLPMNIQDWSPLGWTDWISFQSKGLSRDFSNNTVQKHHSSVLSFLYIPTLKSIHGYWKNHSLTRWTFVGQVISLFFNMLLSWSQLFFQGASVLISWLESPSVVILEPTKIKSATVSPSICHEVMGPDTIIFSFLNVEL